MGFFDLHHRVGAGLASRHRLSRLAMPALCAAFLLAAALLPAQEYIPPQPTPETSTAPPGPLATIHGTLHGVVLNAATSSPLARALVQIEGDADTGALTDGEGRFEIPGVALGQQAVQVVKPGFLDQAFFPGGDPGWGIGPNVNHNILVAAPMPDLIFSMAPTNSIHGRILLSTGDAEQGIGVTLAMRTVEDGRAAWKQLSTVKTNSEGAYRFARLGNGEYALYSEPAMDSELDILLSATGSDSPAARNGFPSLFYPEARDLAGAAKIHLAGGQEAEANFSLTLQPFHTVTAQAILPSRRHYGDQNPAWEGMKLGALVMDAQGHMLPYNAEYDQETRTLRALLPDGNYSFAVIVTISRFTASNAGNNNFTPAMDSAPLTGQVDFSVAGHDVANLRIPLLAQRANPLQVTVTRSGAQAEPGSSASRESGAVYVALSETGESLTNGMVSVYADGAGPGQLETTFMPSGSYWAHTSITQHGLCLASFTAGGTNLAREPLVVGAAGVTAPLDLALRDDCARLTLTLPMAGAAMAPGEERWYTVYVMPDFESTENTTPQTLRPSSGGTVTLEGLTPGNYHVYTFDVPLVVEYHNPAALAALPTPGQAITLSPGTTSSLVLEVPAR
ncbi:MAG: carboxypeptidase-like regulatory domain-containing protein [Terracidiphilus sp.]